LGTISVKIKNTKKQRKKMDKKTTEGERKMEIFVYF